MYSLTVVISGCGFGGSADMALQSRLGLLPERRVGTGVACIASVVLDGPHLIANRTARITPLGALPSARTYSWVFRLPVNLTA